MDVGEELSEFDMMRARNIKELQAMLSEICTPDFEDAVQAINDLQTEPIKIERKKRKRRQDDETFKFTGALPLEMRRSNRLSNVTPQYTYLDLPDEDMREQIDYDDVDNLESVVFRKKKMAMRRSATNYKIVPVEEITSDYLANIAKRNTIKIYSQNGTSCHQCRQKTTDSKTVCRSGRCIGVRGQFCGVCLKNRYGEEARVALMDSRWECPPCRGLCNCSICRTREGKRPTGILAPIAFQRGHKSVKDFLISLNGRGDYVGAQKPVGTKCTDCVHVDLVGFDRDFLPLSLVTYQNGFCDKEYNLIGFNKELKPVLIGVEF